MDWRNLSADELEFEFNPQHSVADFGSFQVERTAASQKARREMTAQLDISYGPSPTRTLDVYPVAPGAANAAPPVHVFFHGGYWRTQDKANFAFIARTLVDLGITTVIANYDLCPEVSLDVVVDSAMQAVVWTRRNAASFGADPERLTLSGNSAGAHLCAMALAHDWTAKGLPASVVKGIVAISGVYDPEPAMHISVNAEIGLTAEIAKRNNVLLLDPGEPVPVALFAGAVEPDYWRQQTHLYAACLENHGFRPTTKIQPGKHHFNIMDNYLDADQPIVRAIRAMV
jgi:arylformamidase